MRVNKRLFETIIREETETVVVAMIKEGIEEMKSGKFRAIRRGGRNDLTNVAIVQSKLNMLGITDNKGRALKVDGKYGGRSVQAVLKFQKENTGVLGKPDGIVGKKTSGLLLKQAAVRPQDRKRQKASSKDRKEYYAKMKKRQQTNKVKAARKLSEEGRAPLHVKGAAYYLSGRTDPFTEKDLDINNYQALTRAVHQITQGGKRPKATLDYDTWRSLSKQADPEYYQKHALTPEKKKELKATGAIPLQAGGETFGGTQFDQLSKFLGAATVQQSGPNTYKVTDVYDFNDAANKSGGLKGFIGDIAQGLVDAAPEMVGGRGSAYAAVRRLIPWREQVGGYKGYPVEIEINLGDAEA